ncbi:PREDICTED: solute carrier family 35 member C2-like isoform X1 [Acropora digitifera]|uniref:solute carrier family 35 member C2-like isoform X1 n=1 Tax=Acropora digitifera TaxID=70779 RepID=UPI000779FB82|nr:PREDICTED: solute carrier family 35 member C2-like isoform X1 [Acropora digitifera]
MSKTSSVFSKKCKTAATSIGASEQRLNSTALSLIFSILVCNSGSCSSLISYRHLHTCTARSLSSVSGQEGNSPFSAIASALDIGCSNWSLMYITVSLYTMTKSTSVIFILMFAIAFGLEQWNFSLVAIVFLIASGLFLFTFESTAFSAEGFVLALLASGLSGLRWTLSQILTQKQELGLHNPLDTLYHLQPFMTLTIIPLAFYIEGEKLAVSPKLFAAPDSHVIWVTVSMLLFGGFLALMISISEFLLLSHTSSLTLSIAGIFKEICILSLATEFAGDKMTMVNFFGLVLCLCGISVHVVTKATKEAESVKVTEMTNGGIELKELLKEYTATSDYEDDEFELNIYGKR